MVTFIKKYYHLTIIISVLAWAGCGSTDNPSNGKLESVSINNENSVNLDYDKTARDEENKDILYRQGKKDEKSLTLADGSQYIAMKDAYGNKIEYRYFENDAPVKYISMETLDDGTTTVFVRTWNGSMKRVNPSLINNPWKSSAQEIASLAGILSDYRSKPRLNNNQSVSIPPQSRAKSTNRIVKNNLPQDLKIAEITTNETNSGIEPE